MDSWDPLDIYSSATTEIVSAARKREIRNILKSYVGFYDPFCELTQNALDAVDLMAREADETDYQREIWVTVDLKSNRLSVTDNGVGFREEQFRMFLSPSISFKDSGDTRGNKGVGATYLAYGFNYLQMGTKYPDFEQVTEIKNGREWIDAEGATVARPLVRESDLIHQPFSSLKRGSTFTLEFSGNVRPKNLSWIGATTAEQWRILLFLKTPLGQLFLEDENKPTILNIDVVAKDGGRTEEVGIPCRYVLPHTVIKGTARVADILAEQQRLIKRGKDPSKLPARYKRLNGVYDSWGTASLRDLRLSDEQKDLLEHHSPRAYGFFCYSAPKVLDKFNDDTAGLRKGQRIIKGGLQLATDSMPQGEMLVIPLTSNIGYQNQAHVIVHLADAEPDLGRKGFQPELQDLGEAIAVGLVGRLKQWRHVLLTDRGPGGSHGEELALDDWIQKQREYEREHPIALKNENFFIPVNEIAISAAPSSEQDVVALFNQLVAGGVIRGVRVMASSSHHQYDGLFRFHLNPPIANHYYNADINPLGIEDSPNPEGFSSKPYVLEFKHSLDALISDFENEEKHEAAIDLAISWEMGGRWKERYQAVSLLIPDNLHLRQFHGVTHEFHDDNTGEKRMDVIILSDLLRFLNDPDSEIENQESLYGDESR